MPPKATNRFALFVDKDDEEPADSKVQTEDDNPFVNQVGEEATPWKEVKRNGNTQKPLKTLTILNTGCKPPVTDTPAKQTRNVSVTSQPSPEMERPANSRENWCGVCSRPFPTKSSIQTHAKSSPGHENYCNLCRRVFRDRNGLQNHVDNAAGHSIFCNICLSAFSDELGLRNHFGNKAAGHHFACLPCLRGFKTKSELEIHLRTGKRHVWCTTCHKKFVNQKERDAHWAATTKHKHCLQPGCEFDAPNAAMLDKHLKEDHFYCKGCKGIFPSRSRLTLHQSICEFDIPCPNNCGISCAGQFKLEDHLTECVPCADSGFNAAIEDNFPLHLTKQTDMKDPVPCWTCESSISSIPADLVKHLESCPKLPIKNLLMILGKWWYSTKYMDIDVHAQIRRNEIDLDTMVSWMNEGVLQPFICRAQSCDRATFPRLSDLVAHVESKECEWDANELRLEELKMEFDRVWRKERAVA